MLSHGVTETEKATRSQIIASCKSNVPLNLSLPHTALRTILNSFVADSGHHCFHNTFWPELVREISCSFPWCKLSYYVMLKGNLQENYCFNNVKLQLQQYFVSIEKTPVKQNTFLILFVLGYIFQLTHRAIIRQKVTKNKSCYVKCLIYFTM